MTMGHGAHVEPGPPPDDRSVGEIVGDIAKELGTLVRQEIELAKTEAKNEARKAGKGAGLLGGSGIAGHLFLIFLTVTVMLALDKAMDIVWAALIVTVIWAVVAGVLAAMGRSRLKEVNPKLETTTETLKEDAQWVSSRKNNG